MAIIPSITTVSVESNANTEVRRRVVVVNGMALYESSGRNSAESSTWFPFAGQATQNNHAILLEGPRAYANGYFVKPGTFLTMNEQGNPPKDFQEMARTFNWFDNKTKDMYYRFGSTVGLLVSSQLGGGLWDTPQGQDFKKYLQQSYPEFYQKIPPMEVAKNGVEVRNPDDTNKWIKRNEGNFKDIHKDVKKFTDKMTSTFKQQNKDSRVQLTSHYKENAKPRGLLNKIAARIVGDSPSVSSPEDDVKPSKPTARK